MTGISKLEDIKSALHQALDVLSPIQDCVLLDYPSYFNLGDHLIWLGEIFYLSNILKANIKYTVSNSQFSQTQLEQKAGKAPILLHGGGNLGDLWSNFQKFREKIILQYRDRPIFILPQSLYFQKPENLKKTAEIFNSHPELTLFVRDNYSQEIANEHFVNCRVIKAPDMAFEMVNMPGLSMPIKPEKSIGYIRRRDQESNHSFAAPALGIPNLVVEDWISLQWISKLPKDWIYVPGLVRLIREGWQKGVATPNQWLSRQQWENFHPYAGQLSRLENPAIHRQSWSMMHSGIYQLKKYRVVITNRLHVHILCLLLNIPHVLLPGSYYKIEAFYNTWTASLPLARFVKDPTQVKSAVEELLSVKDFS